MGTGSDKLKLFKTILLHKWFVLLIGRKMKVGWWRLIKHDWTKFLPCEFSAYARKFYGADDDRAGFDRAWLHHQNSNDHHPEYWIMRTDTGVKFIPVPDQPLREMVADWIGASRAYEGEWPRPETWKWYKKNFPNIILEQDSCSGVLNLLNGYFRSNHKK